MVKTDRDDGASWGSQVSPGARSAPFQPAAGAEKFGRFDRFQRFLSNFGAAQDTGHLANPLQTSHLHKVQLSISAFPTMKRLLQLNETELEL